MPFSRGCKIVVPKLTEPLPCPGGVCIDGRNVRWAELRCLGQLTYIWASSVDVDYLVLQLNDHTHYWVEVNGWSVAMTPELPALWYDSLVPGLVGLERADLFWIGVGAATEGCELWPRAWRGRPMYESRPRRVLGFLPWGDELIPLV